jgi:hypothetical protein
MRKLWILLLILAFSALPTMAQADNGHVRVAHFAPTTGPVDIYVNGELSAVQALEFPTVSEWLELPVGEYDFVVVPAGEALENAVYATEGFSLASGDWYTLAAIGTSGDENFPLTIQPIAEDYSDITDGEARVTFFHAIPNLGAIDVRIADGTELVGGLTYPGQAAALGISDEVAANDGAAIMPDLLTGTYDLQITALDSADVLVETSVNLVTGNSYLVAFVGLADEAQTVVADTDVDAMTAASEPVASDTAQDLATETCDSGGTAHVRLAHFATLSRVDNAVDFFLNGDAVAGLAFADVSDWTEVDSGNYDVAVALAGGTPSDALASGTGAPLCADRWVTLAIIGLAENNTLLIQPIVEDFRPLPDNTARLTVFDGIPDAPPVNIQLSDGNMLIGGLTYPNQASALGISDEPSANDGVAIRTLDIGVYDFEITQQDNTSVVILSFEEFVLDRGHNYLLALIGTVNVPTYALVSTEVPE